ALAVAPGWMVARLGCFSVHDHPGVLTSFPLAVQFPGGARHDLGLYDAIALAAISLVLYAVDRRGLLRNRLLALLGALYGTSRVRKTSSAPASNRSPAIATAPSAT